MATKGGPGRTAMAGDTTHSPERPAPSVLLDVFIPVVIHPKQSTRVYTFRGRARCKKDPKVIANARAIATCLRMQNQFTPRGDEVAGPLELDVVFVFPLLAKGRGCGFKDTAPDLDNCVKQLLDVLESVGFIENDSRVAKMVLEKRRSEHPGIDIQLTRLSVVRRRRQR